MLVQIRRKGARCAESFGSHSEVVEPKFTKRIPDFFGQRRANDFDSGVRWSCRVRAVMQINRVFTQLKLRGARRYRVTRDGLPGKEGPCLRLR